MFPHREGEKASKHESPSGRLWYGRKLSIAVSPSAPVYEDDGLIVARGKEPFAF